MQGGGPGAVQLRDAPAVRARLPDGLHHEAVHLRRADLQGPQELARRRQEEAPHQLQARARRRRGLPTAGGSPTKADGDA